MSKIKSIILIIIVSLVLIGTYNQVEATDVSSATSNRTNDKVTIKKVTGVDLDITENQVIAKWNKVDDADGYEIIINATSYNKKWKYDWGKTEVKFINFPNGMEYKLKIRAYKTIDGKKQYGNYSDEVTFDIPKIDENSTKKLDQVKDVQVTVNDNKASIKWKNVDEAQGYEIIITKQDNNKQWKYNCYMNSVSFSNFPYDNSYIVQIRAYNTKNGEKQYGEYSDEKRFEVKKKAVDPSKKIDKVKIVKTEANDKKAEISWNEVDGTDGYEVILTLVNLDKVWKYDWKSTTIIFNNFPLRAQYTIKVRAYRIVNNEKQYGEYSDEKIFEIKRKEVDPTEKINKVKIEKTNVKDRRVEINWKDIEGIDGYDVIITVANSKTQWKYDWKYTTIIFDNFPKGDKYAVKVRAYRIVNNEKQYGDFSDEVKFNVK